MRSRREWFDGELETYSDEGEIGRDLCAGGDEVKGICRKDWSDIMRSFFGIVRG